MVTTNNANKGLSLKEFIKSLKTELREAMNEDNKMFKLSDVEVEIAIATQLEANGEIKVLSTGVGAKGSENYCHKVKLRLIPSIAPINDSTNEPKRVSADKSDSETKDIFTYINVVSDILTKAEEVNSGDIYLNKEQIDKLQNIAITTQHDELSGFIMAGKPTKDGRIYTASQQHQLIEIISTTEPPTSIGGFDFNPEHKKPT
ncbi:TPA: trypco2 family protein [Vibrio parahaemolyticus]|uniref:trypco2 family protein n=1 Tax=Vibrio parahaemolyticus TaxID=670 RepID=UPI0011211022|nr:trypco2 family protein [Vibrio parahaemolyticus]EGQ7674501.1 hypothetical protein [Vibrio parahaemolyticus]EGQ9217362.1 hypothetical protein [Vibrio parahaemolyticus]HBC3911900.1 hypothetical protein [Vibrio parahaemolyticus]